MSVPRVAITTLGCKTNQFESAAMSEELGRHGYAVVPFEEEADFYIINTCTVTAKTDAESRRIIRRAMRRNASARIVVTGCYAQVSPEELEKMPGVHLVIGNSEKRDIVRLLTEIGHDRRVVVSDISQEGRAEALELETFSEHTRAFLQIQNGCDAYCSYCIVPYARGRSRSVPLPDVLAGIETFTSRGFQEVVLTGIHLTAYGYDLEPRTSLLELLRAVEQRRLTPRLRLGSLEPAEITEELISQMAASGIVCPHLHIPLQSGDDGVLLRMNRTYSGSHARELIHSVIQAIPDACIGADIITGFPGESEEEFQNSLHLVDSLPIAYLHVFPFSPRPGTPAARMSGQLPSGVVAERARQFRLLSEKKKDAYRRLFIGKEVEVLVQSEKSEGLLQGLSRHYLPVIVAGAAALKNHRVSVRITAVDQGSLVGTLTDREAHPAGSKPTAS